MGENAGNSVKSRDCEQCARPRDTARYPFASPVFGEYLGERASAGFGAGNVGSFAARWRTERRVRRSRPPTTSGDIFSKSVKKEEGIEGRSSVGVAVIGEIVLAEH